MAIPQEAYCTYFDHRYAGLGLAMLRSLRACGGAGTIWVVCLSEQAEKLIATFDIDNVRAVPLAEVEEHFPGLEAAKSDRSLIEYYFTLTPHVVRYVFDHALDIERVAYLDSDLFFFGPVAQVWAAMGTAPVAIIPHNFNRGALRLARYGEYNVGWVSFARSTEGLRCLDFWAESCAEWCRDVPDGRRFADQGYLGRFHEFVPNLAIITHKGCNLGPWNVGRYRIRWSGGQVMVDDDPLIFFHFTGFKKGLAGRWFNSHRLYRAGTTVTVRDHIYRPYLAALLDAQAYVEARLGPVPAALAGTKLTRNRGGGVPLRRRLHHVAATGFRVIDLLTGKALAEPRTH